MIRGRPLAGWLGLVACLAACNAAIQFDGGIDAGNGGIGAGGGAGTGGMASTGGAAGVGGRTGTGGISSGVSGTILSGAGGDAACTWDGDCSPSTHCDTSLGRCFLCVGDEHCTAPTPRCDTAAHQCVECGVDIDCQPGQVCSAQHCVTSCPPTSPCLVTAPQCGSCVPCTRDMDCPSRLSACNVVTGKCVECMADGNCTGEERHRCDRTRSVCVECLTSADCSRGSAPACDPSTGTCSDDDGEERDGGGGR